MAKASDDKAHIEYINMGPWPYYVGITADEDAFTREVGRLCPGVDIPFIGEYANATAHYFSRAGELQTVIVAMEPRGKRTLACYAGLIAHEVMHIVQDMRERLVSASSGAREGLGIEAEAYIMQYLTQEMLAITTGSTYRNSTRPHSTKKGSK